MTALNAIEWSLSIPFSLFPNGPDFSLSLSLSLSSFQNIKLISILVQQGKLQEGELESVLKYLFPKK